MGPTDTTGCQMPGTCEWKDPNSKCSPQCPTICGPDEMSCYGGMDANGCMLPGMCMPMYTTGSDGVTQCYSHCPLECGTESLSCPGPIDANGCQMPGTCEWKD